MGHTPKMKRPSRAVSLGETPYGRGVFAKRRFERGEVIGEIRGTVIDDPEYGSDYCMRFGDALIIEPASPFRYVNHSCEPNCALVCFIGWDEETAAHRRKLCLRSLASIGPGEQLTIDYAWSAASAMPCECGSPNCRGWIVAQNELADAVALFDFEEHT